MTGVLFVAYGLWCLVRGAGIAARPAAARGPRQHASPGRSSTWSRSSRPASSSWSSGPRCTRPSASTRATGSRSRRPSSTGWASTRSRAFRGPGTTTSRSWPTTTPRSCSPRASRSRGGSGGAIRSCAPSCCSRRSRSPPGSTAPCAPSRRCCRPGARCWWRSRPPRSRSSSGRTPSPPRRSLFVRFVAFWAVGSLAIYGWAREKVPWLTVHPLLPLTILAALGVVRLWTVRRRPWAAVAARGDAACCSWSTPAGCTSPPSATARTTWRRSPATPRCSPTSRPRGTSSARWPPSTPRRRASPPGSPSSRSSANPRGR